MENTLPKIIRKIEYIKDKNTQTTPEYFFELFIDILKFGGVDKEYDIKRYFQNCLKIMEK